MVRIGIDIGGTKTVGVLLAPDGSALHSVRRPTGHGNADVTSTVEAVLAELSEKSGVHRRAYSSLGIGVPGVVDAVSGEVTHAVNLGITRLSFARELAPSLDPGVVVAVENDVNAAAVGIWRHLDDPMQPSMAYLNLGTGVAAGIVLDGRLWRGRGGTAGEVGHIAVDPTGPLCACGQRGCLELSASGSAIARAWPAGGSKPLSHLLAAADGGDVDAQRIFRSFVESIAAAVRILVLTLDVDVVVIGGGLIAKRSRLIDGVRRVLAEGAEQSPFLASLDLPRRVAHAPDMGTIAAVGAALIAEPAAAAVDPSATAVVARL
ncbi:ROK family protein [Microbacterium dauci]|uniref:ROK family protein n=1 Tax=Microbacterium dauci TaxID=3048008 RepID=A0ABT6ZDC7_9MICO|nr:ROK family protein [Microbacterium sp. LX3-4]MDJ1114154.1 ROK family protein [Microbacterium sp. LX3-4]